MNYFNNLPEDLTHKIKMMNLCDEIENRCLNGVCMEKAYSNLNIWEGRGMGLSAHKNFVCKGCVMYELPEYYLCGELEGVMDFGLYITGNEINTWGQNKLYCSDEYNERHGTTNYWFNPCENTSEWCNGGKAFEIRGKQFCSPCCGNQHFNLKPYDYDFWFHYCDECDDCLDYDEIDESDSEYDSEEEDDEFKCVECE